MSTGGGAEAQTGAASAASPRGGQQGEPVAVPWAQLPEEVLELIGSAFMDARHLDGASRVCKGWRRGFARGVSNIELTVHRDADQWRTRVARLKDLLPSLQRCTAHVGAGVPSVPVAVSALAESFDQKLEHLELRLGQGQELQPPPLPQQQPPQQQGDADGQQHQQQQHQHHQQHHHHHQQQQQQQQLLDLSRLSGLRSIAVRGGSLPPAAAAALLRALAAACPRLEDIVLLPDALGGLGDAEMPLLAAMGGLKRVEFQACRLTGAGLLALTALPRLEALSVSRVDCLAGLDAACFKRCPTLQSLSLSGDYVPPPDIVARLKDIAGLTMSFRATDAAAGLLRTLTMHLTERLVKLDMGVVRVMRTDALDGLTRLARLSDLRLSVTGNSDEPVTLDLGQLAPLSNLEVLHVAKARAYFPDSRRFREASVRVPVDAAAAAALARACARLRSLRLALGAGDVTAEGLAALSALSRLESLSVHAEPFSGPAPTVPLALADLPQGLTSLELKHVAVVDDPAALAARPPLPRLAALALELVRLRAPQLAALAAGAPRLARVRLAGVSGLTDAALASLAALHALEELAVVAPHNRAVTQRGLEALAPLRSLRNLTWQSDDLTAHGPILENFTRFTALRALALSCTKRTMALSLGADYSGTFAAACPYVDLALVDA